MEQSAQNKNLKAGIAALAVCLPENIVSNATVEAGITGYCGPLPSGILERLFGIQSRRYAAAGVQVSDMAADAARQVLESYPCKVDLLIFAAASSDLIEPATANIVQSKLGLQCAVMDIKNACNSAVSAIQTASAFIESGMYQHVLVVVGEKLSEVINFAPANDKQLSRSLAAYSLGDAGAAVLLSANAPKKIVYQSFMSYGAHWSLCTVEGGGSMAIHDPGKYYFEGDPAALRKAFGLYVSDFVEQSFEQSGWARESIDWVITHQVSAGMPLMLAQGLGMAPEKFVNTFRQYGNTAAASIPLALYEAGQSGKLREGDRVMLLGLAAGISMSVQMIQW